MEKEKKQGIVVLVSGVLLLATVLAHFIFDDVSTDQSPLFSNLLLILVGLVNITVGYKMFKK